MHKIHVITTNFVDRFLGKPDTRKNQFGRQDFAIHKVVFKPPDDYRVRIVEVHMDVVAKWSGREDLYIKNDSEDVITSDVWAPSGWALGGLQTTGPEGSRLAHPAADNTIVYRQLEVPGRVEFNLNRAHNGLLMTDHTLLIKHAIFNVVGGREIQIETSGEIVFRFLSPFAFRRLERGTIVSKEINQ